MTLCHRPMTTAQATRFLPSMVDVSSSLSRSVAMFVAYSHEEVTETVASQYGHKRVYSEAPFIMGFPVVPHVINEHASGQEEEQEFEAKEGDEDVDKVSIDTRECAKMLSRNKVTDR